MPKQKDLKRLVRARMKRTGDVYTTARQHLVGKKAPAPDHASLAGMSNAKVAQHTGRSWAEWLAVLDAVGAVGMPHRDIARYVSSLGTPDWWSQMVTVGYERIRGLREKGQRRDGSYEANKSRTFAVPLAKVYKAFATARTRNRWLKAKVRVRTTIADKSVRLQWVDGTIVTIFFVAKGNTKCSVAIQHLKLPSRATADALKRDWGVHLDRLKDFLS